MKNTDDILKDMKKYPVETDVNDNPHSEKMPFNVRGASSGTADPAIQKSKKSASNRSSDIDGASRWDETSDEAQIDDEVITQQSGYGHSPDENGFVSRSSFDYLDYDPSDEISGRNLKDK